MGISSLSIFFFAIFLLCSGDVESSSRRLNTRDPLYHHDHGKALNKPPPSSITPPLPPLELNLRRKPTPTTFAAGSPSLSPLPLPRLYRPSPSVTPTTTLRTDSPSPLLLLLPRLYPQPWPSVTPTTLCTRADHSLSLPSFSLSTEKALNKPPPSSITPPLPPLELNLRRKLTPTTFAADSPLPLQLPKLYPRPWTSIIPTTLGMFSPLSPLPLQRLYHQPWTSVTPTIQGTDSPLSPLPLQRLYQQPWPSVTETFGWFISSRILSQQQWLISSPSSSESIPDRSESESESQSLSSRVVVITGLSVVLFVFLSLGAFFICYNRQQRGEPGGTPDDVPHEVSLPVMSNPPSKNAQSVKSATLYYSPATATPVTPASVTDPGNPSPQPSSTTTVHDFGLKVFKYRDLRKATDGFSKTNCLGEGGFGAVFKGVLPDGKIVAVKLLKNENFKGDIDFRTEVNAISCAIHRHIVSLIGYCIHADKRLIVFEFVANNSLHHYLHGGDKVQVLDWATRVKIALGTAKGLVYLHEDCPRKIIHRDVKPANILLDDNFQAKVADFGIAKLCSDSFVSHLFTGPVGTTGYVDPEYFQTGKLTVKSDVYSFGVVLLELVSGCRPPTVHELVTELPKALKKRNFITLADPGLRKSYDTREMTLMVACADACLRKEPNDRPLMKQIAQVLEGITSADELKKGTKGESCFCFERSKF